MTGGEIASLTASIVSISIGIFAVWLSVTFYRMSNQVTESTREAARNISSNVERLEQLFDKLYTDTFTVVRETMTDMRKHMWPEPTQNETQLAKETEKQIDEKIEALKQKMNLELTNTLKKQAASQESESQKLKELQSIVNKTLHESRKVEDEVRLNVTSEHIRNSIVNMLTDTGSKFLNATTIVSWLGRDDTVRQKDILYELNRLKDEGIIWFDDIMLGPRTKIYLKSRMKT